MARTRPYGDRALLIDVPDLTGVHTLDAALRRDPPDGLVDLVPAARSLLLTFATAEHARRAGPSVVRAASTQHSDAAEEHPLVEIPTRYDGADLDDVAAITGLPVAEVVRRHSAVTYTVSFMGFAPGFGYLGPLDERLHVPRLRTPRTRVPGGSVAIAGDSTAVYPSDSPGGWRLLGSTEVVLFDPAAAHPSLLATGTRVRFVPVGTP